MNKFFLVSVAGVLSLICSETSAQEMIFVAQNTSQTHEDGQKNYPEVLIHIPPATQDNVIMQDTSFVENSAADSSEKTAVRNEDSLPAGIQNKNMSFYAQKLNLTPEQINQVQKINRNSRVKQEQLLQKIQELREQAREIEANSLVEFEAILTDEQKAEFNRLRQQQEPLAESAQKPAAERQPEPMPEPMPQPDDVAMPMPEPMPQPDNGAMPMPEPMPQPDDVAMPMPEPMPQPDNGAMPMPEPMPQPDDVAMSAPEPMPI